MPTSSSKLRLALSREGGAAPSFALSVSGLLSDLPQAQVSPRPCNLRELPSWSLSRRSLCMALVALGAKLAPRPEQRCGTHMQALEEVCKASINPRKRAEQLQSAFLHALSSELLRVHFRSSIGPALFLPSQLQPSAPSSHASPFPADLATRATFCLTAPATRLHLPHPFLPHLSAPAHPPLRALHPRRSLRP